MDQSNLEHHSAASGTSKKALVMAALVPFAVIGLLALPLAFNTLKQLLGL